MPPSHLSFPDQLELLKSRGLAVTDEPLALRHLERIGYYRLKSYWFPLRRTIVAVGPGGSPENQVLEEFIAGSEFQHAVLLYVFDKRLRLLLSDAIERIEVAIRVDLAHALGLRDAFAHRNTSDLDPKRATRIEAGAISRHAEWLIRSDDAEARTRTDWIRAYLQASGSPLPIWMAVETWDFGLLSRLFEMAHPGDRAKIAKKYGLPNPEILVSWLKSLNHVRNICAHHGRLWNHPLVIQPMIPTKIQVPMMSHLGTYTPSHTRVYATAAICQYLLLTISPGSAWKKRLMSLWDEFPAIPQVKPHHAGFMPAWRNQPLWQ